MNLYSVFGGGEHYVYQTKLFLDIYVFSGVHKNQVAISAGKNSRLRREPRDNLCYRAEFFNFWVLSLVVLKEYKK